MSDRTWLRVISRISRQTQSGVRLPRQRRHERRPALEALESRLVLSFVLGTTSLLEGPGSGTSSDIVVGTGGWSAASNAPWLQSSAVGSGNGVATFRFEANPGVTRTGTLTIAGATLTVTQAGGSYAAASPLTTLVSSGLNLPQGLAVDAAGNVLVADWRGKGIKEWNATTQQLTTFYTLPTDLSDDGYQPQGVAVDSAGNVYLSLSAGNFAGQLLKIDPITKSTTTLVTRPMSGAPPLVRPQGLAVDSAGDVFIADRTLQQIKEWNAATQSLTTVVAAGLSGPNDVAVDAAGNLFIANFSDNSIKEWNSTTQSLSSVTDLNSGVFQPLSVAVDASGNLFIGDQSTTPIKEWNASTQTLIPVISDSSPSRTTWGVDVDGSGNLYYDDFSQNFIKKLSRAFVPTGTVDEGAEAGADDLLPVLPASTALNGVFAPSQPDQAWLTTTGPSNGVIHVAFTGNTGSVARTAHLTVLGQTITLTQQPALGTGSLFEGPAAGADSIVVSVAGPWTATANDSWLHTTSSGTGNGLATISFDANPGGIRFGTLTIAGQIVNVSQAGSTYVVANPLTSLISTPLIDPAAVAVDASGNVYFADAGHDAIKEWNAATQAVTTLVSAGLKNPRGVAVDRLGNVYIADTGQDRIKEWIAATGKVITLVRAGLNHPRGVAVDRAGNVYIADTGNDKIKKRNVTTHAVRTLVAEGVNKPHGVAVDSSGNVYIADTDNDAIKEWKRSTRKVTALVSTGLSRPLGVAVDHSGNVYIADTGTNAIKQWHVLTKNVTSLAGAPQLINPSGVAVFAAGSVFIADTGGNAIRALPRAFVPGNAFKENAAAGSDMLFPVLPTNTLLTGAFAPSTDRGWLTITGVTSGVVRFAFSANNTGVDRTGNLIVLGQMIPVTQAAAD
jgi:streptogramin lyase